MKITYDRSDDVKKFLSDNMPDGPYDFDDKCAAIGIVDKDNNLVAGVIFNNWQPKRGTIEVSAYSSTKKWLSNGNLLLIASYPFTVCGCQMVYARTSEKSKHIHSMLTRFGFTPTRIPRMRGSDEDEIIFTLTIQDWMSNKFMSRILEKE